MFVAEHVLSVSVVPAGDPAALRPMTRAFAQPLRLSEPSTHALGGGAQKSMQVPSDVHFLPPEHWASVLHCTQLEVAPALLQTGVAPPHGAHVAPHAPSFAQTWQPPPVQSWFAPQLVAVQVQAPAPQLGVVPLQAPHAGPQCDAVSQALHAPASQKLPVAQLASETHWTHWPPPQILPAAAQLAQLAPHFVAVSQLTHWPASHDLPAPQSTSAAHARQAPFAQPLGHVTGLSEYVQFPSTQVPLEPCVRSVFASLQSAAGGFWQTTPTQALPTHASFAQPFVHVTVLEV